MHCLNFRSCGLLSLVAGWLIAGCSNVKLRKIQSPPHYNFSVVYTHKLDPKLREISGLAWDNKRDEFITHQDESGKLFYLDKETKIIKAEYKFAGKGDYEDVAVINSVPYVLRSDGLITRVLRDSAGNVSGEELGKPGIAGNNDFESMYYDPGRKALILLCKNCETDQKTGVSAFAFYIDSTGFDANPVFTIPTADVKKASPVAASRLEPSAATIHPVLQKLFILSSASHQLVIASLDGKVEGVYELGKKLFPQPEGLTFKSNGDMYISNEGKTGRATILRFTYKP
ncbi:MAG: SdiA-regulated domain-containing protein [Sphingobacteriales bacterium]|nr:SdiA-regulated domain-containing protein [Sphingobacteriales bacterium]